MSNPRPDIAPPPIPHVLKHRVVQFQIVDDDLIALDTTGQLWVTKLRWDGRTSQTLGAWQRIAGPLDGQG